MTIKWVFFFLPFLGDSVVLVTQAQSKSSVFGFSLPWASLLGSGLMGSKVQICMVNGIIISILRGQVWT